MQLAWCSTKPSSVRSGYESLSILQWENCSVNVLMHIKENTNLSVFVVKFQVKRSKYECFSVLLLLEFDKSVFWTACHCPVTCGVLCASLGHDCLLSNACSPASSSCCCSSSSSALPKMAGDGERVHTHAHGFRGYAAKLLPVRAIFVHGLHLGGANCPWAHASQSYELLWVRVHGVNAPELAAGVPEEDEEVVGGTLLHFLRFDEVRSDEQEVRQPINKCASQ